MTEVLSYVVLFAVAFLAATIFPAQSEVVFAGMVASGQYHLVALLSVATAGNTLGSCVNWVVGRFLHRFESKPWFPVSKRSIERAESWYAKWGLWSLLLSWAPVIGDAVTIIAGMLRVRFIHFLMLVTVAKGGRYLLVAVAAQTVSEKLS